MNNRNFTKNQQILMDFHGEIANYLSSFGLKGDELKDAVQDTYTEAFASLHRLKDEDKIKHWVIVIAKRVGKKHQRKQRRRKDNETSFDETEIHLQDSNLYENDFVEELVHKEDVNELRKCINSLKPKERKVLLLHEFYGIKFKDVSVIVGENLSNTKSIARRAKIKLKNNLLQESQNDLNQRFIRNRRSEIREKINEGGLYHEK